MCYSDLSGMGPDVESGVGSDVGSGVVPAWTWAWAWAGAWALALVDRSTRAGPQHVTHRESAPQVESAVN